MDTKTLQHTLFQRTVGGIQLNFTQSRCIEIHGPDLIVLINFSGSTLFKIQLNAILHFSVLTTYKDCLQLKLFNKTNK